MKTLCTLVFIAILSLSTDAICQIEKGDRFASISFAPYPTTSNDEKDFGIIVKADAEFLLTNRLSFVTSGFYSSNTAFENASGVRLNAFGIIPSLQYYVVNKDRWNVHVLAGYGFGFTDRAFGGAENSAISIVSLGAGASYKISEKFYLKLQVPYFKAQNISYDFTEVEGAAPFFGVAYNF
ncbi:porin family protein [Dokdonia sinensis]|uniref:Porin family protein n=1 Tax=Dokdonia sinensis TaxID=2479847 RepID=A0A3M0GDN5_9FLAO|nr:outer membrane beta-barrel protein [Dokdonia sinensis]RMB63271.1 porin family protein [Dokdonia sinensis]